MVDFFEVCFCSRKRKEMVSVLGFGSALNEGEGKTNCREFLQGKKRRRLVSKNRMKRLPIYRLLQRTGSS
jgi:predicted NUDIX family phosphoesterase